MNKNEYGDYRFWRNTFEIATQTQVCRPAGIGYYSADGELVATSCPPGLSTHTDTATSADDCAVLCTGGATKLHTGQYVYNLWRDKTTKPALHVRLPDGDICYANMVTGTGKVNIRYNDTVYHVTN